MENTKIFLIFFETRLISIVSKPIKVVVVVIVVFVEKKLGKNIFLSKKNPCPKNLRPKSVGSNKNLVKKICPKKCCPKT